MRNSWTRPVVTIFDQINWPSHLWGMSRWNSKLRYLHDETPPENTSWNCNWRVFDRLPKWRTIGISALILKSCEIDLPGENKNSGGRDEYPWSNDRADDDSHTVHQCDFSFHHHFAVGLGMAIGLQYFGDFIIRDASLLAALTVLVVCRHVVTFFFSRHGFLKTSPSSKCSVLCTFFACSMTHSTCDT